METKNYLEFIKFLQGDLAVTDSELNLALRGGNTEPCLLLVTLWRYGFITLEQMEQSFDRLAATGLEPVLA